MGYDGTLKFDTSLDNSGFQDGINAIGGYAKTAMNATAKIIGAATAAVTGLGAAAVNVGVSFEASMSNVAAISGATGKELEQLTEKAKEMGARTKFSASESADAFSYMAMAGWKTADMLDGIEGIMNLAAASGENLATTSDIVTDALTAFGMSASDSTHFSDVLAAASANANTNVGLMGETFKYVGTMAGTLGYSIEDTALAVGLMANAGLKGTMAGTSLNSILTRLSTNTGKARDAIEALGVSFFDEEGQARPLIDVMTELRAATADMNDEQKTALANTVAGMEGQKGLNAILNASQADYDKLASAIAGATDETTGYSAAAEMAAIMQDNLQGQLTILKSNLEGLGISIYENLEGPLKDTVVAAQDMIGQLSTAFSEGGFEGLVQAAGSVFADIAVSAANEAPKLVEAALTLLGSFVDSIMQNKEQVIESGVTLITALVEGLFEFSGELWSAAIELGGGIISGLLENLPELGNAALEMVFQIGESIRTAVPQFLETGLDVIHGLADGIRENLPELIPVAMESLTQLSGFLRENAGLIVDAGLDLIMALADSLIENIPVFIETVPTIITNLGNIINDNAPKLIESGLELIAKLAAGLIQAIPTLIANIPQIIQAIVTTFTAFNWVELGSTIITFIKTGITNLASALPDALRKIGQTARDGLHNIDWANLGRTVINFIVNGVRTLVTSIPNALRSIGQSAFNAFKNIDWIDLGGSIVQGIISGVNGALDGLINAARNLARSAFDAVKNFFDIGSPSKKMKKDVGRWIPPGIGEGIEAEMPALERDVQKEMENLANTMKDAVRLETGDITLNRRENAQHAADTENPVINNKFEAQWRGESTTNLYLDGRKVGKAVAPYVDEVLG